MGNFLIFLKIRLNVQLEPRTTDWDPKGNYKHDLTHSFPLILPLSKTNEIYILKFNTPQNKNLDWKKIHLTYSNDQSMKNRKDVV